jgi:hypothetical protein
MTAYMQFFRTAFHPTQPRQNCRGFFVCIASSALLLSASFMDHTPPLATLDAPFDPLEAALVPAPRQETFWFGIDQQGRLYAYGESYGTPRRVIEEATGLAFHALLDCQISERAGREYLELRLLSPVPNCTFVLALPCQGSIKGDGSVSTQWSVRSLMGALCEAAYRLPDTAGILTARRGTGGASGLKANFIDLFLANSEQPDSPIRQVFADAIDGDRNSLEIAVNQVRRALDLLPQFP